MRYSLPPSRVATPLLTLLLVLLLVPAAHADSSPAISTTMTTVKNFAGAFLRAGMAVGTVIALLKVTKNFLSGNPNSISSILWLVGGIVVFFAWGTFFRQSLGTWAAPTAGVGNIGNGQLNAGVSTGAYLMAEKVLEVMLTTVVPLLLFVTVGFTVIRGFISSGSVQFELGPLFRVFFMYMILVNYNNVVPLVGNLIGGLADTIEKNRPSGYASTSAAYDVLKKLRAAEDEAKKQNTGQVTPDANDAGKGTESDAGLIAGLAGDIGTKLSTFAQSFSPQNIITGFATDMVTGLIQAIMEFLQSFLLGFLYVAGPIALTFSLLPGFGGLAKGWLQSLIGIHMWSIAFQVIAGLFVYYQAADSALQYSSASSTVMTVTGLAHMKFVVGCIVFIIMYVMVPYMSSLIVGSSAADGFVGSAVRIASTVASGGGAAGVAALKTAGAGAEAVNLAGSAGGGLKGALSTAGSFAGGARNHMGSAIGSIGADRDGNGGIGQSMSQIGQMFRSAPMMSGAGSQAAAASPVRSTVSEAPVPSRSGGGGGGSSSSSTSGYAQQAAATGGSESPSMPAPIITSSPAVVAQQAAAAVSDARNDGGSTVGFSRNAPARPAVPAAPAAPSANQAPPSLNGGRV